MNEYIDILKEKNKQIPYTLDDVLNNNINNWDIQ